jgi:hypothetical protein
MHIVFVNRSKADRSRAHAACLGVGDHGFEHGVDDLVLPGPVIGVIHTAESTVTVVCLCLDYQYGQNESRDGRDYGYDP